MLHVAGPPVGFWLEGVDMSHPIAAVINGVAYDASGVQISNADLPKPLQRRIADRQGTAKAINLLHENDSPQNCQQHDAD